MKEHKIPKHRSQALPLFLLCGAAVLTLVIVLTVQIVKKAARIDPFPYISVSFTGYNTNGQADVIFQKPALIEDILMEGVEKSGELGSWLLQYDAYDRGIQVQCTPETGLSNGDKVTVTIDVSGAAEKKVKPGTASYTVAGLPEVQKIDIFQQIDLAFEGIGGNAMAKLVPLQDSELLQRCNFAIEPQYALRNGDTVTVTLSNPDVIAEQFLCLPTQTEKTFTVFGLEEYLTDPDLLPEDAIRDIITRHLVGSQKKDDSWFSYSAPQYYKTYFFTAQEGSYFTDANRLEIYVSFDEYLHGEFRNTLYVPIIFTNLLLSPEGTIDLSYENGSRSVFYTDPDSIPQRDGYDVEEVYIEY